MKKNILFIFIFLNLIIINNNSFATQFSCIFSIDTVVAKCNVFIKVFIKALCCGGYKNDSRDQQKVSATIINSKTNVLPDLQLLEEGGNQIDIDQQYLRKNKQQE